MVYLRDHVQIVKNIHKDIDRSRDEIYEEILTIFENAINLDFSFILSKGEQ
jgi:hypothetical protein